jgi:2'-5' RNA ligase
MNPLVNPSEQGRLFSDEPETAPFEPERLLSGEAADDYLLFFALLPPPAVAERMRAQGARLKAQHGLRQALMPRLHLTLQPVAAFRHGVPRLLVHAAIDAAAGISAAGRATRLHFDRAGSMRQAAPTALALHADAPSASALAQWRQPLVRALQRRGLAVEAHNHPHVTLVYGAPVVALETIQPIDWVAERLSLVLSHRGQGHHEILREWAWPAPACQAAVPA